MIEKQKMQLMHIRQKQEKMKQQIREQRMKTTQKFINQPSTIPSIGQSAQQVRTHQVFSIGKSVQKIRRV
jgi:hypothetical protein